MSKFKKALERAKENKTSKNDNMLLLDNKENTKYNEEIKTKIERRKEISVRYHNTKIIKINYDFLKSNKIFSFLKEFEATDRINMLRTQILKKLKNINGNSILITSANSYEGKTTISLNLGLSIAQELDRTVLIVDADLKKPQSEHKDLANDFFGIKTEKGLTDYLKGECDIEDIIINPAIEKLTIIPSGKYLENSSEFLNSLKMEKFIDEIKRRYKNDRIIIFDCSAVLRSTEPVLLSSFVDGTLIIVEEEKTTKEDLKKVLQLFNDKTILGIVLNKAHEKTELL